MDCEHAKQKIVTCEAWQASGKQVRLGAWSRSRSSSQCSWQAGRGRAPPRGAFREVKISKLDQGGQPMNRARALACGDLSSCRLRTSTGGLLNLLALSSNGAWSLQHFEPYCTPTVQYALLSRGDVGTATPPRTVLERERRLMLCQLEHGGSQNLKCRPVSLPVLSCVCSLRIVSTVYSTATQ